MLSLTQSLRSQQSGPINGKPVSGKRRKPKLIGSGDEFKGNALKLKYLEESNNGEIDPSECSVTEESYSTFSSDYTPVRETSLQTGGSRRSVTRGRSFRSKLSRNSSGRKLACRSASPPPSAPVNPRLQRHESKKRLDELGVSDHVTAMAKAPSSPRRKAALTRSLSNAPEEATKLRKSDSFASEEESASSFASDESESESEDATKEEASRTNLKRSASTSRIVRRGGGFMTEPPAGRKMKPLPRRTRESTKADPPSNSSPLRSPRAAPARTHSSKELSRSFVQDLPAMKEDLQRILRRAKSLQDLGVKAEDDYYNILKEANDSAHVERDVRESDDYGNHPDIEMRAAAIKKKKNKLNKKSSSSKSSSKKSSKKKRSKADSASSKSSSSKSKKSSSDPEEAAPAATPAPSLVGHFLRSTSASIETYEKILQETNDSAHIPRMEMSSHHRRVDAKSSDMTI